MGRMFDCTGNRGKAFVDTLTDFCGRQGIIQNDSIPMLFIHVPAGIVVFPGNISCHLLRRGVQVNDFHHIAFCAAKFIFGNCEKGAEPFGVVLAAPDGVFRGFRPQMLQPALISLLYIGDDGLSLLALEDFRNKAAVCDSTQGCFVFLAHGADKAANSSFYKMQDIRLVSNRVGQRGRQLSCPADSKGQQQMAFG